jgi:hypothetical protein
MNAIASAIASRCAFTTAWASSDRPCERSAACRIDTLFCGENVRS